MFGRLSLRGVAIALAVAASARAFSFNVDTKSPKSCEDFTVSWSDARSPYYLLLTPPFGVPRNYSLEAGQSSFTTTLPFGKSKKFVATMIDSNGQGVSSDILTAGESSSSCNTDEPNTEYQFELNSALQQCRPYVFSGYNTANKPVTIYGIIPLGDLIVLQTDSSDNWYQWTANVAEGTSIIFLMVDYSGKSGGASDTKLVGASDDSSCLNDSSPTTTATPSASSDNDSGSHISIGAIAGTVLGCLVFLAVVVTLGLFYLRKRAGDRQPWEPKKRRQSLAVLEVDPPSYDRHQGEFMPSGGQYDADPFIVPPPVTYQPPSSASASDTDHAAAAAAHSRTLSMNSGALSSSTSKGGQTPTTSRYAHSRFILHTDVEDVEPAPDADGVIELPPQYTERRRRPSDAHANSSTDLLGRNEKDGSYEMNTPSTAGGSGWPAPDPHP